MTKQNAILGYTTQQQQQQSKNSTIAKCELIEHISWQCDQEYVRKLFGTNQNKHNTLKLNIIFGKM